MVGVVSGFDKKKKIKKGKTMWEKFENGFFFRIFWINGRTMWFLLFLDFFSIFWIFLIFVGLFCLTLYATGGGFRPLVVSPASQNRPGPKAREFATLICIKFHTFSENLGSLAYVEQKLWGFLGGWLHICYISPYKTENA